MSNPFDREVVIIGGGPAGLSAALTLGRARRSTTLYGAGPPRNAPAREAHNVFTRDGTPPLELLRIGREQLEPYDSVEVRQTLVSDVEKLPGGGFAVISEDGQRVTAEQVILATGVVDKLPPIAGLRELWGTGVFHCPYCHGWEVRDQPFVLIAQHEGAVHFAQILRGWSTDITVCPVSRSLLDAEQIAMLASLGIAVKAPVVALVGNAAGTVQEIILEDDTRLGAAAVYTSAKLRQRSPLPERLGCTLHTEGLFAGLVQVDVHGFSGVPGLYVVGDASQGFAQVLSAAYEGSNTAAMLNGDLLLRGRLPYGAVSRLRAE